ncbi:MAG: Thioredoxin-like protein [Alphaproteobacteria bacterium MarineAlpha11_Bin1]|nr:MAG: Thioredoxin-like protein [Alphaproteobacteria bacterium MarineAlpha11_Bin1]|tara:strand:+ start:45544 stop:45894 length:351 start_codon:yes stop_codon:yes gene_type:complete
MSTFRDISQVEVFDEVIGSGSLTLVKFQSELCVICRKLDPMLVAVKNGFEKSINVANADVEANIDLANRYNIQTLPTLILFKKGTELDRLQGFQTASMLRNWITPFLESLGNERKK